MPQTKGLEGVVATTSTISSIVESVLRYKGYNIDDLAENSSFEEVIYLLWNDELPKKQELDAFKEELNENMDVSRKFSIKSKIFHWKASIRWQCLRTLFPLWVCSMRKRMKWKKQQISAKHSVSRRKCLLIVAGFARIREGKEPVAPTQGFELCSQFPLYAE